MIFNFLLNLVIILTRLAIFCPFSENVLCILVRFVYFGAFLVRFLCAVRSGAFWLRLSGVFSMGFETQHFPGPF